MLNLKIVVGSDGKDQQRTFEPGLFFSILRAAGDDPHIRHGGVYCRIFPQSKIISEVSAWAAMHDPDGSERQAYARRLWDARPPGVDLIVLG